jgi:hypothetical protein
MTDTAPVDTAPASVDSSPAVDAPVSVPTDTAPLDSGSGAESEIALPDGQRMFERTYVEKLREEAARYRTQLREQQEAAAKYEVFGKYEDDDYQVWQSLADTYLRDPAQAAEMMRTISERILGGATPEEATQQVIAEQTDDDVFVTPDKVAELVKAELAREREAAQQEAAVESIYAEIREAGFDPMSIDGYQVLWRATNETGGDIAKAVASHRAYRQQIIDDYVRGKSSQPNAAPAPNGTTGQARPKIDNLNDAFAAGQEFLRNVGAVG